MTTKKRLIKYKNLKDNDPVAAYQFFLENENDERFANLIRMGDDLIEFVNDFLQEGGDILDEKKFRQYLEKRFRE